MGFTGTPHGGWRTGGVGEQHANARRHDCADGTRRTGAGPTNRHNTRKREGGPRHTGAAF